MNAIVFLLTSAEKSRMILRRRNDRCEHVDVPCYLLQMVGRADPGEITMYADVVRY